MNGMDHMQASRYGLTQDAEDAANRDTRQNGQKLMFQRRTYAACLSPTTHCRGAR
jgi:hypothetical protein